MKLGGHRGSGNIVDRRGVAVGGGLGIGGIVVVLVAMFFGVDPAALLGVVEQAAPQQQRQAREGPPTDEAGQFVSRVLASTEDVWHPIFRASGGAYVEPKLVLFSGATRSSCGLGQAAMGPFYCPSDQSVYLDTEFFRDLSTRFRAPGDFAQAYVIAHEVGHHVQRSTGVMEKLQQMRGRVPRERYNRMQVRLELQADCYAGIWGHHAAGRGLLDPGDVDEGLAAAAAVGDDRLQKQAQGYVVPESFTHGSSEQRARWFKRGLESGNVGDCDTFSDASP